MDRMHSGYDFTIPLHQGGVRPSRKFAQRDGGVPGRWHEKADNHPHIYSSLRGSSSPSFATALCRQKDI